MEEKTCKKINRYLNNKPLRIAISFFLLLTWLNFQFRFDSMMSQAVLCAMVSAVAFCESIRNGYRMSEHGKLAIILFALAFSGANVLANCSVFFIWCEEGDRFSCTSFCNRVLAGEEYPDMGG